MSQAPAAIDDVMGWESRAARRLSMPGRTRLPMLRILWRQHGVALTVIVMFYVIAAAALGYSEPILGHIARSVGARSWNAALWQTSFGPHYPDLAMQAIPLLIAMFVGVRLVSHELEDGIAAFAWTQGYSPARWLLGKLAAAAAVLVPAAVAFGLVFGWWYQVYLPAGFFTMNSFALYAPALAGWTLTGLTLGMAVAAATRREILSRALTIVGWIVLHRTVTLGSAGLPASDFWPLQAAQFVILASLSALFAGITIWLIRGAAPALPGMPRLLRTMPWQLGRDRLAGKLASRPRLRIARATLRQHRTGLLIAVGALGIYAIILLFTGLHIHAEPARLRPSLASLTGFYTYTAGASQNGDLLLPLLLPFVIGAFAGATLAGSDLERGTATFAWTQGITRARWIASKLITTGLVLVLPAIAVGLIFQWWNQPYSADRFADPAFGLYAPVFAGWMLVTLTAGAFLGAVTRSRTGAAVICLVCTLATAWYNAIFLRPSHYLPPVNAVGRLAPAGSLLLDWSPGKPDGQPLTGKAAQRAERAFFNGANWTKIAHELGRLHAASIQTYQPASRFWPFQTVEAAVLLTIALILGAATVWVVHRRPA